VYGNGENIRDWIYVKDHVNALMSVTLDGVAGKQYLIGGNNEVSNVELLHTIVAVYETITNQKVDWDWFEYVDDRPGHDFRYSIDNRDFRMEFPNFKLTSFETAINETIRSYL